MNRTNFPAVSCHSDEKTKGDFSSFCQNDGFAWTYSPDIILYLGKILNCRSTEEKTEMGYLQLTKVGVY